MKTVGNFFRNLRLGVKLAMGFSLLVGLTLAVVAFLYLGSAPATRVINRTSVLRVPAALISARAQAHLLQMLSDVRGYLALGDQGYRQSYDQSAQAFSADLEDLSRLAPQLDAANSQRLTQLKKIFAEEWSRLPGPLFELRDDQLEREPAYRLLATDGSRLAGTILIDINSLIELQAQNPPSEENQQMLGQMAKFQGTFASMFSALRGYVTTRNRIYRQEYDVNLSANQFAWEALSQRRAELSAVQQAQLDEIAAYRQDFLAKIPGEVERLLGSDQWRQDLYLFRTQAVPLADTMQKLLSEMATTQQSLLAREAAEGTQQLSNANLQSLFGGAVALVLGIVLTLLFWSSIAGPVRRLTAVAEQIRGGDLKIQAAVESGDEIGTLAETFNRMTSQLRQTLRQVRFEKKRADDLLDVVIPIGVELASEKDFDRLLESMVKEAKAFCHAAAGVLYLVTPDQQLKFVIFRDDRRGVALGGATGEPVPLAPVPLYDPATGEPNRRNIAARTVLTMQPVNIADAEQAAQFDLAPQASADEPLRLSASTWLSLPLQNREHRALGVLQLLDARDRETGQVIPFDPSLQQMMMSFSSLAVAALEAYIREQSLRQEIHQLRIEIDEVKRRAQVAEIVKSDSFKEIQEKARVMRQRRRENEQAPQEPPAPGT
jgi:HAMP domain-containing protein